MSDTPGRPENMPTELDLPTAMQLAIHLHRNERFEDAEKLYTRILELAPEHPDVLHYLGLLKHRTGAKQEGIALIRRSVVLVPDFPDFHINLGNVLVEDGDPDAALPEYQTALRLKPNSAEAWANVGSILRERKQHDAAMQALERAIELDPKLSTAYNNMGMLYRELGDIENCIASYCRALEIDPASIEGLKLLGMACYTEERFDLAADAFRRWLELAPDDPGARHLFAACSGQDPPERAADAYVAAAFDDYAPQFEEQLQNKLHYRAPELVAEALESRLPPPEKQFELLDAGCGTGLCGPLVAPWSSRLVGIDLSAGMLELARAKNCYDQLDKAELTAWLLTHPDSCDVLLSADTLCYFGSLDVFSRVACAALRPGGRLVYTVERLLTPEPGEEVRLAPSGRYQHTAEHIRGTLGRAGFVEITLAEAHLRTECGKPVEGLVVTAEKPEG